MLRNSDISNCGKTWSQTFTLVTAGTFTISKPQGILQVLCRVPLSSPDLDKTSVTFANSSPFPCKGVILGLSSSPPLKESGGPLHELGVVSDPLQFGTTAIQKVVQKISSTTYGNESSWRVWISLRNKDWKVKYHNMKVRGGASYCSFKISTRIILYLSKKRKKQ